MARLVFLQLNEYELHGPESISALLSAHGHKTRLVAAGLERDPMAVIADFEPSVVGIGLTTVEREEALAWARAIKKRTAAAVLLGGIDPTFRPELALEPGVDAVVRGEAELTLLELMDRVERGEDFSDLPNLAVNRGGELIENPIRPLLENLDDLPFPDKELYLGPYKYYRSYPTRFFMASRGCPHNCNYCANRGLRKLYPNPECYVRFKSPRYLAEEIRLTISRHPARTIGFNDDLFTHRLSWLEEFLPLYKKTIGKPFFCCARIDQMDDEKARLLAECGCYACFYGLETANPKTRELMLGRRMDNEQIKQGVTALHRRGIKTQSYNMLNLPGETLEDGLATLRFNLELKNDFVVASLFQPFVGTELAERLVAEGRIDHLERLSNRETLSYFAFSSAGDERAPEPAETVHHREPFSRADSSH